jgi:hypothetical protein
MRQEASEGASIAAVRDALVSRQVPANAADKSLAQVQGEAEYKSAQQKAVASDEINALNNKQVADTKQAELNAEKRLLASRQMQVDKKLSDLDNNLYNKLKVERDNFIVDSMKNKYMNESMLTQFKLGQTKTQAEFNAFTQDLQQRGQQKLQMMEIINSKMKQQIELEMASNQSRLEAEHLKQMQAIQMAWDKKIADEQKRQAKRQGLHNMLNSVGTGVLAAGLAASGGWALVAAGAGILAVENLTGSGSEGGALTQGLGKPFGI